MITMRGMTKREGCWPRRRDCESTTQKKNTYDHRTNGNSAAQRQLILDRDTFTVVTQSAEQYIMIDHQLGKPPTYLRSPEQWAAE